MPQDTKRLDPERAILEYLVGSGLITETARHVATVILAGQPLSENQQRIFHKQIADVWFHLDCVKCHEAICIEEIPEAIESGTVAAVASNCTRARSCCSRPATCGLDERHFAVPAKPTPNSKRFVPRQTKAGNVGMVGADRGRLDSAPRMEAQDTGRKDLGRTGEGSITGGIYLVKPVDLKSLTKFLAILLLGVETPCVAIAD